MAENQRLRSTLKSTGHSTRTLGEELGVDPKTIQRWVTQGRTPHPNTAERAAKILSVPANFLWPDLDNRTSGSPNEVVNLYPHRSQVPDSLWLEILLAARHEIYFTTYASLFFGEDNPEGIQILKHKANNGVKVRLTLGDPESEAAKIRAKEEGIPVPDRIRMALAYYRPLIESENVEFRIHQTNLYNSIYRFDDQMLINQHIYGTYGYMAPILHLRKVDGGELFPMYEKSESLIWEQSYAAPALHP